MTIAMVTRTAFNVLQNPRGRSPDYSAAPERSMIAGRSMSIPNKPSGLVDRAMLFTLDRDSELRARYLRQRWRNFAEWHARHSASVMAPSSRPANDAPSVEGNDEGRS